MLEAPPIDVDRALTTLGLVSTGGTGTAGGWLARRPEDERPAYELLVVPAPLDERFAERVRRFTQVRHEHLAAVHAVAAIDAGRTGVLVTHLAGVSLAAIRRARAPLTDGECVTLLVPLSEALSALAAADLAHGAVDADRVLVQPDGRPALVDPRPGLLGTAVGQDDLPRLLATVVGVTPEPDGALLAGPSSTPRLRPVLEQLLREGCSAEAVVQRCFATVEPEAVRLPDPAALAGAALLPAAGRPFPVSAGASARRLPRPTSDRGRRRAAAPRPGRRRTVTIAAAVSVLVVAAAVTVLGPGRHLVGDASTGPSAAPSAEPIRDRTDPAGAAAELTRHRGEVLADGTAGRLSEVAAPGGPSAEADARLMASLAGRKLDGLTVRVQATDLVGAPTADDADVSVTSVVSGYVGVDAVGGRSTVAPAPSSTMVLHLRWTPDGWRVWSVSAPAAAP